MQFKHSVDQFENSKGLLDDYRYVRNYVPLLGLVCAGGGVEYYEQDEEIHVPYWLCDDVTKSFALQVQGNSMVGAGILPGDYVILQRGKIPTDGKIVVASVEGNQFLRRYFRHEEGVLLKPENKEYAPTLTKSVHIQGVYVGLIRKD